MKIKREINGKFNWGVEKARWAFSCSVIALCKESGIDSSVDIQFTRTLVINTTKTVVRNSKVCYETSTILADAISWSQEHDFFSLKYHGEFIASSHFLSLDALCDVFKEMKNVIRAL